MYLNIENVPVCFSGLPILFFFMPEQHWDQFLTHPEPSFYSARWDKEWFCDPVTPAGVMTSSWGNLWESDCSPEIHPGIFTVPTTALFKHHSTKDPLGTSSEDGKPFGSVMEVLSVSAVQAFPGSERGAKLTSRQWSSCSPQLGCSSYHHAARCWNVASPNRRCFLECPNFRDSSGKASLTLV